jgi:hypothetical protein
VSRDMNELSHYGGYSYTLLCMLVEMDSDYLHRAVLRIFELPYSFEFSPPDCEPKFKLAIMPTKPVSLSIASVFSLLLSTPASKFCG